MLCFEVYEDPFDTRSVATQFPLPIIFFWLSLNQNCQTDPPKFHQSEQYTAKLLQPFQFSYHQLDLLVSLLFSLHKYPILLEAFLFRLILSKAHSLLLRVVVQLDDFVSLFLELLSVAFQVNSSLSLYSIISIVLSSS